MIDKANVNAITHIFYRNNIDVNVTESLLKKGEKEIYYNDVDR